MSHDIAKGSKNDWDWSVPEHVLTFTFPVAGGEAGDMEANLRAGGLTQDLHIDKLIVSLENAPGGIKTITVTLDNGVSTMTVVVSAAEVYGTTTTNNFDLDVSTQDLTLLMSSDGGILAGLVTVWVIYRHIHI